MKAVHLIQAVSVRVITTLSGGKDFQFDDGASNKLFFFVGKISTSDKKDGKTVTLGGSLKVGDFKMDSKSTVKMTLTFPVEVTSKIAVIIKNNIILF
jgi:hypothetical protein